MGFFYTDSNNQVQGPISMETLKQLRENGTIQSSTFVIEENGSQWKSYEEIVPSEPTLKTSGGLSSAASTGRTDTTTLYTLTHTGPINLRQIEISKKTPKAILLKDYTRLADGTKKKLLMIGIDNISKTPEHAVRVFITSQQERVAQAKQLLLKEESKLSQAEKLLEDIVANKA